MQKSIFYHNPLSPRFSILSPNLSAYITFGKSSKVFFTIRLGGLMGHKYQFFVELYCKIFPKRTLVITISDQVLH